MSIRIRLLLSYIAMLIVPVVLFILAGLLLAAVFLGDLKAAGKFYNLDFLNHQEVRELLHRESAMAYELRYLARHQPERLQNGAYLQELDQQLQEVQSGLILRINDNVRFVSPFLEKLQIAPHLPAFAKGYETERDNRPLKVGDRFFSYRQIDFYLPDHSSASIFIVTDASPMVEVARKFFPLLAGVLLLALILTNGLLTYLVSRSIIKPLNQLKTAAEQIKEGNLDFQLTVAAKDEIGQVSMTFEEMRRKLKESIELQLQYEENRKELISNISHDLQSPIATIKGYVEGIRDGVADTPEKMQKYIETIYSKAGDLDRLIDELFLFSKLDLKKSPFQFEKIEVRRYLQDLLEEIQFDLNKRGVSLHYQSNLHEPVYAVADREKLKRVIMNVIDNSLKYMNKTDKRLEVELRQGGTGDDPETDSETVQIRISDNGPGIEAAALPHIFDRFYRGDPSRNPSQPGSGLGLAIAKRIIEEHGGRIWAESRLGEGATIWIALPQSKDKAGDRA